MHSWVAGTPPGYYSKVKTYLVLYPHLPYRDPTNVVIPVIDTIDTETLEYQGATDFLLGGFNWNLEFTWHPVPEHEDKRRGHSWVERSALNDKYLDIPGSSLQSHHGRRSLQYRQTFL